MASENKKVPVKSLPFYTDSSEGSYVAQKEEPCFVQDGFKVVREGVNEGVAVYKDARDSVNHVIETGQAHSSAAYFQVSPKYIFVKQR